QVIPPWVEPRPPRSGMKILRLRPHWKREGRPAEPFLACQEEVFVFVDLAPPQPADRRRSHHPVFFGQLMYDGQVPASVCIGPPDRALEPFGEELGARAREGDQADRLGPDGVRPELLS